MIAIIKFKPGNEATDAYDEMIAGWLLADDIEDAREKVQARIVNGDEGMTALADDLRFYEARNPGKHKLSSGYILLTDLD